MEPKLRFTDKNTPIHFSVGAIIKNDKGEYLLIDRLKTPLGFACPAGHVDEGELSYTAIIREVEEETGLKPIKIKEIEFEDYDGIPKEACSRGVIHHMWTVFEIEAIGELIFKADEVKSIGWYSVEEIKKLNLEKVWEYFFKKFNII